MSGKGFGNLSDIDSQLNGQPQVKEYEPLNQERGEDNSTIVGDLSRVMTDRTKSIETGQQDEIALIRDQSMGGVVKRLAAKVISEQEVMGYAMALNNGTPIPDHLPSNEKEHIRQAAMLLKMSDQGLAIFDFRATPRAAIEGLRNVPALNPHIN